MRRSSVGAGIQFVSSYALKCASRQPRRSAAAVSWDEIPPLNLYRVWPRHPFFRIYVHRVGRTARLGQAGELTLPSRVPQALRRGSFAAPPPAAAAMALPHTRATPSVISTRDKETTYEAVHGVLGNSILRVPGSHPWKPVSRFLGGVDTFAPAATADGAPFLTVPNAAAAATLRGATLRREREGETLVVDSAFAASRRTASSNLFAYASEPSLSSRLSPPLGLFCVYLLPSLRPAQPSLLPYPMPGPAVHR